MIPQDHMAAVTRGLNEAFGVSRFDDIRDLTERPGSNRAFRISVDGSAYLLRINTRAGDMPRQFACMQAAADAGLAPVVRYASAEDRVSITDFVNSVPMRAIDARIRIPAALRSLHALPPFPESPFNTTCTFLLNEGPALFGFLHQFQSSDILPENETKELLTHYEQLKGVYSRLGPDKAPSHNDLFKPDNMLFDGARLWFVDWEAAFQNDRYADLAVVANMIVTNDAEEDAFLQEYFGQAPTDYQRARLCLMRQIAHLFYAMAFLTVGSSEHKIDWTEPVPAYDDFQRPFWEREVGLADGHAKGLYGRVHLQRLFDNIRQGRLIAALQVLES